MRILIAEDDVASRELLAELLAAAGHVAVSASDGRGALAAMQKDDFDLILVDQQMPRMDGLALAREIRSGEQRSGKRVAIIGLSGNASAEDERECHEAGMDAFLAKPFNRIALYQAIEAVRNGTSQIASSTVSPVENSAPIAAQLLNVTGEDQKLQRSLIRTFLADVPQKLLNIEQAIKRQDCRKLAGAAHSLKGALGIFNATAAVECARKLELMGRALDLKGAPQELALLTREIDLLRRDLHLIRQDADARKSKHSRRNANR